MAPSTISILAAGLALSASTVRAAPQCSKYTVDTTEKTYAFNHYSFIDFRNKGDQMNSYLQSSEFTNNYRISTWTKQPSGANYGFTNLVSNVKIADNDAAPGQTMLSLSALSDENDNHSASELESVDSDFFYASIRMGVRVTGASGACAGLFFYHSDTQETDIEILTQEQAPHKDAETQESAAATTSQLHFTNQPKATKTVDLSLLNNTLSTLTGASKIAQKPASWENFNDYRIDWTPGKTLWWQNGEMSHTETKNMIQNPSAWLMNLWSNGDPSWSGIMAPNTKARMDIAWVEVAYNKYAEGAPVEVASATAAANKDCALGLGDGTSLLDKSVKAGPAGALSGDGSGGSSGSADGSGTGAGAVPPAPAAASSTASSTASADSPASTAGTPTTNDEIQTGSGTGTGTGTKVAVVTVTVTAQAFVA